MPEEELPITTYVKVVVENLPQMILVFDEVLMELGLYRGQKVVGSMVTKVMLAQALAEKRWIEKGAIKK